MVSTRDALKSGHFAERQAQRGIRDDEIALALGWGTRFYEGADRVYFLGRRHLLRARRACGAAVVPDSLARHAEGVTVVQAADGRLVTTFRNPRFIASLKRRGR